MASRARLSPREIRELWLVLAPAKRAEAEQRIRSGRTLGKLSRGSRPETGRVRDQIGRLGGVSGVLAEKCNAIYEAAERDPELFGPVVEYLERSENIHDAFNRMQRIADLARVGRLAPALGRFATLVLDPPWQDESVSPNQRPPYATMTEPELAAMPVADWALDQGHIYCHAPGPFLPMAVRLVQGWGYDFKQVLTFRKTSYSMGRYFRTLDEYCVFATRGGLMLARADLPNMFEGAPCRHSEKPESFYALVRAASPGPYGEAFQRQARPDFTNLFTEAPLARAAA
ncbi:MT-A70 family methyltransferase [Methylorubrum zatmanii]